MYPLQQTDNTLNGWHTYATLPWRTILCDFIMDKLRSGTTICVSELGLQQH